jgi:hypothetical protein
MKALENRVKDAENQATEATKRVNIFFNICINNLNLY